MSRVTVAQSAGFCFGVRRAVDLAEREAAQHQALYSYGEIIHNTHEIHRLEGLGVRTAECLDDIPDGAAVLIRAHGVTRAVYEALEAKGCTIYDATCPFVAKIHRIVEAESNAGRRIIILGSKNHPEVLGIAGWCQNAAVYENSEQLLQALDELGLPPETPVSVVGQTTLNRVSWNISVKILKKRYTNCKIFDTICNATDERQTEARSLAGRSDCMVVIGDKKSSNTKRLYEISASLCPHVLHIEDATELGTSDIEALRGLTVGITAGASTPAWIIKEVSNMMSAETKIETNEDFAAMLEESFKTLNNGDKVTGTVIAVSPTEVQVDLGVKHTAYIPVSELSDDPSYKVEEHVKPGDEIEAVVVRVNDLEGTVALSKKRVDQLKGWETIEAAKEEHTPVELSLIHI